MKISPLQVVLLLVLAVFLGLAGALAATHWMPAHRSSGMHDFVHGELNLTGEQEARLAKLEDAFAVERRRLESDLRAANAKLAAAMDEEHEFGPHVGSAIDEVHARMGELQKATVRHVLNMRELLNPEQQQAFDSQVRQALTTDARE